MVQNELARLADSAKKKKKGSSACNPPARACLVEAIGTKVLRTKVKHRKAGIEGKLAPSNKAQYSLELYQ